MRVVVTEIGWDGSIRRRVLDTSVLTDADQWDNLIERILAFPPPYRAALASPCTSSTPETALSLSLSRTSPARCGTW